MNSDKIADGIKAGSRIIGNAGALIQSGSQAVESAKNLYDSYVKDGEVISWKNTTDLITLGLSVAGMGMAGKSLAKDGKALKAVSQGNVNVKPAAVSNSTGSSGRLNTYGDALREKLGPAYLSHPEEYNAILNKAKEMGVSIEFRTGTLAYDMELGKAGKLIIDPEASIGALRHEYRHMLDDFSLDHPGMRIIADSNKFWELEFRGYLEELNLARKTKNYDAGKFIINEMRQRRREILGK